MGDPMRRIDVQEFRTQAPDVLAGNEALTVEREGQAVGVYLPLPQHQSRDKETSMADLQAAIDAALAGGSMSRDELADLFDLRQPLS